MRRMSSNMPNGVIIQVLISKSLRFSTANHMGNERAYSSLGESHTSPTPTRKSTIPKNFAGTDV